MSNQSKKTSILSVANTISITDRMVIITDPSGSPATETITFDNVKKAIISNSTPTANTPAVQGTLFYDSNFLYVTVANNIIKKVALSNL